MEVVKETFKIGVHWVHLFSHIEDDFNTGKVNAKVAGQGKNQLQTLEIRIGIEPSVTFRTRWFQQPFALVKTQRLRMHATLICSRPYRVAFSLAFHAPP